MSNLAATSHSIEDTLKIGSRIAAQLQPGDVVALYGDLGSGKTHLAKGIAQGLGYNPDDVGSPTFTLISEYAGGRHDLYHVDVYRLERLEELFDLGFEEYLDRGGICVIEWANRVENLLPDDTIRIRIQHTGKETRAINVVDQP